MIREFKQTVKHYIKGNKVAILEARNGRVYPCTVSDRVRLTKDMNDGDTVIVRITNRGAWVIVDVVKKDYAPVMVEHTNGVIV